MEARGSAVVPLAASNNVPLGQRVSATFTPAAPLATNRVYTATITVGGATHAGTAPAVQARADLQVAYTAAAALTSTSMLATLDGRTLTPGVYTSSAALALNTSLTLDAEGDPNAVFIFQIDAALDTAATASSIMLTRGAQASNIFWQVSGAVTLGATSSFKGTIIGLAAITVGASTRLDGRALTINGNVTLASNTISN